jgi:hypothetical protein
MLDRVEPPPTSEAGTSTEDRLLGFLHFTCPSLSHLIALLCRPTASCMSEDTSLIVIDSLSMLVNQAFPKVHESRRTPKGGGGSPNMCRWRFVALTQAKSQL